MQNNYDIVFIGSGPAGFTGAIRAAQLGKNVAVIEIGFLGGVCLNRGCIPTKSLLHSTQILSDLKKTDRFGINIDNMTFDLSKMLELRTQTIEKIRASLEKTMKANNIDIIQGLATLDQNAKLTVTKGNDITEINYDKLVIATGSSPRIFDNIPADKVLTSDTILGLSDLPEKTLIIGSGAIGTEWARILNALDKKVCVIELADRLVPAMDESISSTLERIFKKSKIEFYTNVSVNEYIGNKAILSNGKEIEFDKILVAVGRIPNLFGFENAPIERNNGFIKVDDNFKTNMDNIYAVGDIIGKQMLAHTAAAQSKKLVEYLFENKKIEICYRNIPAIIYGKPEIATVGYTEKALRDNGYEYKVSKLPLTISAKAFIDGEVDGIVKVLSVNDKIVGASVVANDASSLLQQLTLAINLETPICNLEDIIFAHPTTSEAILETILNLNDKSIYVPPKTR